MKSILLILPAGVRILALSFLASASATALIPEPDVSASIPAQAPQPDWAWPLQPRPAVLSSAVLRNFDPPAKPWLSGHRGLDLRTSSPRATVTSPAAGTISFAGTVVDRPVITVDHGGGLKSSFEPVTAAFPAGTPVAAGDLIGTVEAGHCSGMPCVHWGVRQGETYINPLGFFTDLRPSVLLPLTEAG